ncbi:MAG: hypothetical protein RSD35_06325 [Oscillospiraceae bacterium]
MRCASGDSSDKKSDILPNVGQVMAPPTKEQWKSNGSKKTVKPIS